MRNGLIRSFLVGDETIKGFLIGIFSVLRVLLWISAVVFVGIELLEALMTKELQHLAMFAIFFLIANLQIGIGKYLLSIDETERANKLLLLSVFMICAAFLEIVDGGLDKGLVVLSAQSVGLAYQVLSASEAAIGVLALCLAAYSVDRFFVQMKSIIRHLKALRV